LATLGMRNIAANILWTQALAHQKRQEWTALSATLEQITKVQPNFLKVWEHQAWNLSYNVSAEFDDYRGRYFWVMKGIRFLQDGIAHNESSPRLVSSLGWFISQKIGTADEKVQYRRLFRDDNDFHGPRPFDQRDNWLVGRQYYLEAERVAERENALDSLNINPVIFFSRAPKNRINYAVALEEDGVFEEKASVAWNSAYRDWLNLGARDIYKGPDQSVRLNDRDPLMRRIDELMAQFNALPPAGRREEIYQEKLANLPKAEREALERPAAERSENEILRAASAEPKLQVSLAEQSERVAPEHRAEATKLVSEIEDLHNRLSGVERDREVTNYPFWLMRCDVEVRPETLAARQLIYQADKAFRVDQDLLRAKGLYEQGFAKWDEVLKQFPQMRSDALFGDDMMPFINRYRTLLKRLDEPFPDKFPLQDILDANRQP
jgi:hypothetical protein